MKPLICARRPQGVNAGTRLAKIITLLDRIIVGYQMPIPPDGERAMAGWGRLRVEVSEGRVCCRVVGEVVRPNPFEYVFHSFWLTRRGMIYVIAGLLEQRSPESRLPEEVFIQPIGSFDRGLKGQAARWLRR